MQEITIAHVQRIKKKFKNKQTNGSGSKADKNAHAHAVRRPTVS